MSHDPQNDPFFYSHHVRYVTDVEGVVLEIRIDQDGEEFAVAPWEGQP